MFVLILLFTFILLGIGAFTSGSALGMVVNSVIPAGTAMSSFLLGGDEEAEKEGEDDSVQVEELVDKVMDGLIDEV